MAAVTLRCADSSLSELMSIVILLLCHLLLVNVGLECGRLASADFCACVHFPDALYCFVFCLLGVLWGGIQDTARASLLGLHVRYGVCKLADGEAFGFVLDDVGD